MPVWNTHSREVSARLVKSPLIHLYPNPLQHSLCVRSCFLFIKLYRAGAMIITYLQRTLRHGKVKSISKALKAGEWQSQTQSKVHVPMCSVVPDSLRPCGRSPPGSSVNGISQARILEWVAVSSSRGSSPPRDRTHTSCASCFEHNASNYSSSLPPLYPKCPHQFLFLDKNVEIWLFQHSFIHSFNMLI